MKLIKLVGVVAFEWRMANGGPGAELVPKAVGLQVGEVPHLRFLKGQGGELESAHPTHLKPHPLGVMLGGKLRS